MQRHCLRSLGGGCWRGPQPACSPGVLTHAVALRRACEGFLPSFCPVLCPAAPFTAHLCNPFPQADALDAQREQAAAALQAAPSSSTSSTSNPAGAAAFPDIRAFLRPVGVMETRYVRALSSLCALTYHLDKLTVRAAWSDGCREALGWLRQAIPAQCVPSS